MTTSPTVRYARSADGTSIAYCVVDRNQGTPIIELLPPQWAHIPLHRQQVWTKHEAPGDGDRVIVSPRGAGQSDRKPSDRSAEAYGQDVLAVADALGYERFVVRAKNLMAVPLISLAASAPERVSSVVIHDPIATGEKMWFGTFGRADRAMAEHNWDDWSESHEYLRYGWRTDFEVFAGVDLASHARNIARLCRASLTAEDYFAWVDGSLSWNATQYAARVQCPVLCMDVRLTARRLGGSDAEFLARLMPTAELAGLRHTTEQVDAINKFPGVPAGSGTDGQHGGFRTILFTDIVASTPLLAELKDQKMRTVMRQHDEVLESAVTGNGGRVIKTIGDAFMAEFLRPSSAVEAAIAAQRGVRERFADWDEPIHLRIGINAGEPIEEDGDLHGASVVIAKRLESEADVGGILVSDVVRQAVTGKEFEFEDRGEVSLKGFEEPVRTWSVKW